MPMNRPTAAELIRAVREHLEGKVQPELSGALAYETRVAANVLRILERELAQAGEAAEAERQRLERLLGRSGSVEELNASLCDRIAAGELDWNDAQLFEHLWRTTLDKLAIDSPRYAAYRRAIERSQ
jgi:hypothetical protein